MKQTVLETGAFGPLLCRSVLSQHDHNKRFDVNMRHLCTYPDCLFYGADDLQTFYAAPCRYSL